MYRNFSIGLFPGVLGTLAPLSSGITQFYQPIDFAELAA
jgi:hypothetical protein